MKLSSLVNCFTVDTFLQIKKRTSSGHFFDGTAHDLLLSSDYGNIRADYFKKTVLKIKTVDRNIICVEIEES